MIKLHIIYKPRAILQLSNKAGEKHKNMVPGLSYDGLWVISMETEGLLCKGNNTRSS
jgi:hypothetical protein